jgi:hypothetical protein
MSVSARTHIVNADSNGNISLGDIQAIIQVISPVANESYTGDVSLNISIHFNAYSPDPNSTSIIPYHDIKCIYQLDNGEWKNASLSFASEQSAFWSWVNNVNELWVDCNYSALLQDLSNGVHSICVAVNVDVIPSLDSRTYYGNDGSEYHYSNSVVNFHVLSNSEQTVPTNQSATQEIVFGIATVLTVIIISSLIVVLRRRSFR